MMASVEFGFYNALGCKFDATPDEMKKAFRKLSLKLHPDRNPGDDEAKNKFQRVNEAHTCLSDEAERQKYDAVFRMRCVLEQGRLTPEGLRAAPLDALYMFTVYQQKSLGMVREGRVLMVNLLDGIASGRVERWRHGESIDARPLSALRAVDAAGEATLKLTFESGTGSNTTQSLLTRSAGDCATLVALLRALTAESHMLALRNDDAIMPPAPKLTAWLQFKPQSTSALSAAFNKTSKVFAMLGRSKLLMFADALCTNLKLLITLEAGTVQVQHEEGAKELELSMQPSSGSSSERSSKGSSQQRFRVTLTADTPFVAGQWAQAISECLLRRVPSTDENDEDLKRAIAASMADVSEPAQQPPDDAATRPRSSSEPAATSKTEDVAVGDLLGSGVWTADGEQIAGRPNNNGSSSSSSAAAAANVTGSPAPFIDLLTPSPPRGAQQQQTQQQQQASLMDALFAQPTNSSMASNNSSNGSLSSSGAGTAGTRVLTLVKPTSDSRLGLDIDLNADGLVAVLEVVPGGLAERAGLRVDDVILRVAGQPVRTTDDVVDLLSAASGPIGIEVRRVGPPPQPPPPPQQPDKVPPPPPQQAVDVGDATGLDESWIAQLVELGLTQGQAANALRASGNRGVAAAADHHFMNVPASPRPEPIAMTPRNLMDD